MKIRNLILFIFYLVLLIMILNKVLNQQLIIWMGMRLIKKNYWCSIKTKENLSPNNFKSNKLKKKINTTT
jgi:hypothetical protein